MRQVYRFCLDEGGTTAVEYGLLIGLIAMAIMGAVNALFGNIGNPFVRVNNHVSP